MARRIHWMVSSACITPSFFFNFSSYGKGSLIITSLTSCQIGNTKRAIIPKIVKLCKTKLFPFISILSQLLQILRKKKLELNSWNSIENTWEVFGTSYIVKGKVKNCILINLSFILCILFFSRTAIQ